ncbi:MAG: FtsQ-type POTRA domain-containing protein [Chloroflexi bacterium]|nr:FtsQ-type POTRA domain-containing protein [Chloroflexota bacterium]
MANVADKRREAEKRRDSSQAKPGVRRVLLWSLRSGKLMALIVLAVAGWLLYDALTSPGYVVRAVSAQGVTALSNDDVQTLAGVTGQSIWLVRGDEIEARIRQSPYVERVTARVLLPDTVVVQVTERRPEVRWTHNGTTYAVTWDGLVLAGAPPSAAATQPLTTTESISAPATISETGAVSQTQEGDVPGPAFVSSVAIVDTTPNRELKAGDKVDPDALEVARRVTLRAGELPAPLQRIEWDAGLGVSLIVADNKQVIIGKGERLDEKLAILAHLLHDSTPFSVLDLRTTTPYYR